MPSSVTGTTPRRPSPQASTSPCSTTPRRSTQPPPGRRGRWRAPEPPSRPRGPTPCHTCLSASTRSSRTAGASPGWSGRSTSSTTGHIASHGRSHRHHRYHPRWQRAGSAVFTLNAISTGKWGNDLAYRLVYPTPRRVPRCSPWRSSGQLPAGAVACHLRGVETFASLLGHGDGSQARAGWTPRSTRSSGRATSAVTGLQTGSGASEIPNPADGNAIPFGGGIDPEPPAASDLLTGTDLPQGIEGPMIINIAGLLPDAAFINNPGDAPTHPSGQDLRRQLLSPRRPSPVERRDVGQRLCPPRATGATGYLTTMK